MTFLYYRTFYYYIMYVWCLTAGKLSSDGNDVDIASPSDKLQSWSSLFRNKFHRNVSSSSSSSLLHDEHNLPVHSDLSRPFKPVGYKRQSSMVDGSVYVSHQGAPLTVSSECPLLPTSAAPDSSPRLSSGYLPIAPSSESPLMRDNVTDNSEMLQTVSSNSFTEMLQTVSSENPLPLMCNLSDDSGSEEDPTIESKHRSVNKEDAANNCSRAPAPSTLSAAARISMALSKSDSLSKRDSDTDTGHRTGTSEHCYVAPSTKISMAVSAQTSNIGRRLSTMLHNNRLRQQSSTGMKLH